MRITSGLALCLLAAVGLSAQMPREQKIADFTHLAALYAKNYAPYEWKLETQKFDLFDLRPWLERVERSKDDLEFYEICIEYVAALNDGHDLFALPSEFTASLGLTVDIYDGKVLIDGIDRSRLPTGEYPFQVGDELVSVDGRGVEELMSAFSKYAVAANPRSTRREAASLLVFRVQTLMPHAHEIGDSATLVIRRASGAEETYTLPWRKIGTPITFVGPVPSPKLPERRAADAPAEDETLPEYLRPLAPLRNLRWSREPHGVRGLGARAPVFTARPSGFQQRLGRNPSEFFYSGIFDVEGLRVGFLRIPHYGPASATSALREFETEIRFFEENTDGLVIDQMRNPGGDACFVEELARRVIPYAFRTMGFEVRATAFWLSEAGFALSLAKLQGAPQWVIDLLESHFKAIESAYRENRGRTGSLPLCGPGLAVSTATVAYSKPLIVLNDEFSASAAEMFPAILQDNLRGVLMGMRTLGAGGSVVSFDATAYSEGTASITISLMTRKDPVVTSEYPTAPYIENIGVRPHIYYDFMTRENLMTGGRPFVDAFTAAIVNEVRAARGDRPTSE